MLQARWDAVSDVGWTVSSCRSEVITLTLSQDVNASICENGSSFATHVGVKFDLF